MATARRRATGSARQRAAENRWLDIPWLSLSPAARPAFFIRWRAAEESAGRGATMATARRRATGSARQRAAENRRLDTPWLLSLRPLGRHSLSVGGQPKNLPVGAPRWRRRDEELRGQQGNEPLKTAGWIVPLAALSPAARPAFFIRWRAAEESAGRGATMATARRSKRSNKRKTRRLPTNRPGSSFAYEESDFQRTATRQQLDCAGTL